MSEKKDEVVAEIGTLNELAKAVHENALEKGFWEDGDNYQKFISLISSELGEFIEADRCGKTAFVEEFKNLDDKSVGHDFEDLFKHLVKDSREDEIADVFIRTLDICGGLGHDLDSVPEYEFIDHDGLVHDSQSIHSVVNRMNHILTGIAMMESRIGYLGTPYVAKEFRRVLFWCQILADMCGADLEWHIAHKMRYNLGREPKHGKNY